jgi:acyl carrier protein
MLPRKILQRFVQPMAFRATPIQTRFFFSTTQHININPEVQEKIMHILKNSPKCNQSELNLDAKFTDLGFDSLDVVELMIAFEETLGYDLPDEAADKDMGTVKEAVLEFSKYFPSESTDSR